ncbi:Protein of unknown function (DUF4239) [Streptomyces noursei ATCC 11455]|uniref:bestrophin-like domain n=1 Tax=Streptomyces noursei TaxID=1971 RepID=UPI00081C541F|nr:Protein of unknown function (DUF4239) [Streptomyces noursei ATCC 11455]
MLEPVLIVLASCALAWGALLLIQKVWPPTQRAPHNDVLGFVYAVVGVLYAMVLAFMVIVVWENTGAAQQTVYAEMVALRQVHDLAAALPAGQGAGVIAEERAYVESVITHEWPHIDHGVDPKTEQHAANLRTAMLRINPGTDPQQQAIYTHLLDRQHDWLLSRRERIERAGEGIKPAFWWFMVIGAVLTIGYIYLFGLTRTWPHLITTLIPTIMIVGMLVLIWDASKPFHGMISISPEPFKTMLTSWQ